MSQHELLGVSRSVSDYLGKSGTETGFANVYAWIRSGTPPGLFAFTDANGRFRVGSGSDSNFQSEVEDIAVRPGRLFRLVPALSPNMPIRDATGTMIARPTAGNLPADVAQFSHARLGLQIAVYEVPSISTPIQGLQPVFIYDTTLSR